MCLPVKQSGIALFSPTQTDGSIWTESCVITGHLIAALRRTAYFWSGYHSLLMGEVRDEICRRHAEAAESALGEGGGGGGCRNHGGRPLDGTDHADGDVAVSSPLRRQWDGVRVVGVK